MQGLVAENRQIKGGRHRLKEIVVGPHRLRIVPDHQVAERHQVRINLGRPRL